MEFTKEEISEIEKNLGFIVFDWAKHLITHIVSQARGKGVDTVYMNTNESLSSDVNVSNDSKIDYFYTKLPPMLGFKLEQAELRDNGLESMWAYHLNTVTSAFIRDLLIKTAKTYALEDIPITYQGAFIGMLGKKPSYTDEEVRRVVSIIEKKKGNEGNKKKSGPKFYYDWDSTEWSGAQRFRKDVVENVVLQKIPSSTQDLIQSNPSLLKFWAFILSHPQHFSSDTIGFALISKISQKAWVINEVQTDVINAYMHLRRIDKKVEDSGEGINIDTLRDMLQAQNRSKWITVINGNEAFANQLMQNPNIIAQLPDDSNDIDAWIAEQTEQMAEQGATRGLDLIQHFQSVNFNSRIHRIY